MTFSKRVTAARKYAGYTQEGLAEEVKRVFPAIETFSQAAVAKLENGQTLKSGYVAHIAYVCGVSAIWIAAGYGEMLKEVCSPVKCVESEVSTEVCKKINELHALIK